MATPSLSATFNFVKKYPITLCGFSLLFMPSVHRLLLYFSPLLLSTAIFIVAMMSWGPSASSQKSTAKRGKPKVVGERHEWAFHETMGIDEEEGDETEDEVEDQREDDSLAGLAASGAEPDPDLANQQGDAVGTVASGSHFQAEPESDLDREASSGAGTTTSSADRQGEPDPDLQEGVGTGASGAGRRAEPDPDLRGEGVGTLAKDGAQLQQGGGLAAQYGMRPAHDISPDVHGFDAARRALAMDPIHDHKHEQERIPMVEKPPNYLQICA